VIEAKDLVKVFTDSKNGEVRAVDGVALQAHPGQVLGVLGVNGAGKTTLLRMLSTVIQPTSGTAVIDGFDTVKDSEEVRKRIGFLSGSTALYGRLNAREVLTYFGGFYGLQGDQLKQRIEEVIERFGIEPFADRLCDKMSTGQKQRVSIARAVLHDPPILMFDEPTSGLDVLTAQTVMEFIEEAREAGRTILYSTHIMSEAQRLCDNICIIHEGVIRGEGTPAELLESTQETLIEKAFLKVIGFKSEEAAV
jgi:sodium transport system ATP-binding protein